MKTTDNFKNTVKSYLDQRAENDTQFAEKYANENKNIDDCATYILNTVKNSGCNGFTDEEVFGMAVHYYDEESIDVGKGIGARVVINHTIELTEEEKAEAHQKAIDKYQADILKKEHDRKAKKLEKIAEKKVEEVTEVEQLSLF